MLVASRSLTQEPAVELLAAQGEDRDEDLFASVQGYYFDDNDAHSLSSAFSLGYPGVRIAGHPWIAEADVLHLHQVARFLSPLNVRQLIELGKPVVWTLHDAWPFTGGCHQPLDCGEFREACNTCGQLQKDRFQLPAALLADKIALLPASNLTLIATSKWIAQAARESRVFQGARIEQIAPPVLDLPKAHRESNRLRLLFGCEAPISNRRRAPQLQQLFATAQTYGAFPRLVRSGKLAVSLFGVTERDVSLPDLPVRYLGTPNSEQELAEIFSSSDLLVLPSADENIPAIVLEARQHRLPIVALEAAGLTDVSRLLKRLDMRPLAEAFCDLACHPALVRELAAKVEAPRELVSGRYVEVYRELAQAPRTGSETAVAGPRSELVCTIERIVRAIAAEHVDTALPVERDARPQLENAKKMIRSMDALIAEAQRNLSRIQRRQEAILAMPTLPEAAATQLRRAQQSTAKLSNKIKWRSRRVKIFQAAQPRPAPSAAHGGEAVPAAAPEIPLLIRGISSLVLKNYWMKHGRKIQYAPRQVRYEIFPQPVRKSLPRIAIVTPSFMQGPYLEQTIRSVVEQDYPSLAYTVQDGGSTDQSVEIIKRYAGRLATWASHPDSGQTRAIITGFEKISGEIMAWLNSDDLLVPGALRFVGEYFARHPNVDAIYGNRILINEHDQEIARWVLPPHDAEVARVVSCVPQETLFWRSALWDEVGGLDPSFRLSMDWDLVLRFQTAGARIVRIPYFLGCFRYHSRQKTSAQMESLGAEEVAYLRWREHGRAFSYDDLLPYKEWLATYGGLYSRLLDFGIRL